MESKVHKNIVVLLNGDFSDPRRVKVPGGLRQMLILSDERGRGGSVKC